MKIKIIRWIKSFFGPKTTLPKGAAPVSAQAPPWYIKAQEEIGTKEIIGPKHHSRIVEYHSVTFKANDDETPWCASFVSWCFEKCGIKSTRSAWARSYLAWGVPCQPKLGCVVVLQRGGPKAKTGHVGFYVKSNLLTVTLLGGNQSNQVCYYDYPKWKVLGYRWPKA